MKRFLSFDLGTRHIGICYLAVHENASFEVLEWCVESCVPETLNVNLTPIQTLAPMFYEYILQRKWPTMAPDLVFIESQPMGLKGSARNLKTKVLSHLLQCYMMHLYPSSPVDFIMPSLKLKSMVRTSERPTYAQNKKFAVDLTRTHLASTKCLNPDKCLSIFDAPKVRGIKQVKKDDFADSFLQGYLAGLLHMEGKVVGLQTRPKLDEAQTDSKEKPKAKPKAKKTKADQLNSEHKKVPKKRKLLHDSELIVVE